MGTANNEKSKISGRSPASKIKGEHIEQRLGDIDASILPMLVGERDQHLRTIENALEVKFGRAEDGFVISGLDTEVTLAADLVTQLAELLVKGETIYPGDVERAIKMLSADRRAKLADLFRDQLVIHGRKQRIVPKTFRQKEYIEAIKENDVIFGVGPAGTGKTYLAMAMAVSALMNREVKRVVLCRPAVEAGEKLGFLPGDMAEKVNPYLRPLYDALHDMVDYDKAEELVEKGVIEVAPLAFMRGRTLSKAFVILDEAQNTTPAQMKMILTRLGPGAKCVVAGDATQTDLPRGSMSGLHEAISILKDIQGISVVEFGAEDVIRHRIVGEIVKAYNKKEEGDD